MIHIALRPHLAPQSVGKLVGRLTLAAFTCSAALPRQLICVGLSGVGSGHVAAAVPRLVGRVCVYRDLQARSRGLSTGPSTGRTLRWFPAPRAHYGVHD